MYGRFVERRVEEALSDTPVVLIVGPRQAGKTTLVRKMGETGRTYHGNEFRLTGLRWRDDPGEDV
jgi:predicted AAA+ superfamily ATPase